MTPPSKSLSIDDIKALSKVGPPPFSFSPFSHPDLGLIHPNGDFPLWAAHTERELLPQRKNTPKTLILGLQRDKKKKQFGTPEKAKSAWICAARKQTPPQHPPHFQAQNQKQKSPISMLWKSAKKHPKLNILEKQKSPQFGENLG